jgi:hypothetical protein
MSIEREPMDEVPALAFGALDPKVPFIGFQHEFH